MKIITVALFVAAWMVALALPGCGGVTAVEDDSGLGASVDVAQAVGSDARAEDRMALPERSETDGAVPSPETHSSIDTGALPSEDLPACPAGQIYSTVAHHECPIMHPGNTCVDGCQTPCVSPKGWVCTDGCGNCYGR